MSTVTLSRLARRIGDMGLPAVVWLVHMPDGSDCGFYDRMKADAFAREDPIRYVNDVPLIIKDPRL